MRGILSASQAAKIAGCHTKAIQERMKRGLWDIGTVFTPEQTGISTYRYEVVPRKLANKLDISLDELYERLDE